MEAYQVWEQHRDTVVLQGASLSPADVQARYPWLGAVTLFGAPTQSLSVTTFRLVTDRRRIFIGRPGEVDPGFPRHPQPSRPDSFSIFEWSSDRGSRPFQHWNAEELCQHLPSLADALDGDYLTELLVQIPGWLLSIVPAESVSPLLALSADEGLSDLSLYQ